MTTPIRFLGSFAAAGALALLAGAAMAGEPGYGPDRPPHARPGQCFRKVERPPVYDTVREQVVDQPGQTATRTIPAEYRWEDRQVLVSPGRVEETPVAEVSHEVSETVVVRPPSVRVDTLPPVYDTVMQTVMVSPGRTYWKPTWGPTGEILCLVSDPPVYETRPQTVLREPGRTVQTPIPGENRVVVRRMIDAPAHVERHDIPPVYRTDRVRVTVTPERTETYDVPPTYRTVERRRVVSEGGFEWREIACAAPPPCAISCAPPPPPPPPPCGPCAAPPPPCGAGPACRPVGIAEPPQGAPPPMRRERERRRERVAFSGSHPANMTAQIQTALRRKGYYKGPVDGLYTSETSGSLAAFQRDNALPAGPPTPRTARALGVY